MQGTRQQQVQQKLQLVRQATFASGHEFSNLFIGCVLLGDVNLIIAEVELAQPI